MSLRSLKAVGDPDAPRLDLIAIAGAGAALSGAVALLAFGQPWGGIALLAVAGLLVDGAAASPLTDRD